jgi:MerR family transcriptional regulator, mercuric resistance operon regulatory protein
MAEVTNSRALWIGDLSRRTGVNIETIRYYERIGLIAPPARTRGGHRAFDGETLRRLGFVRRCRELGFSLDEIRALLTLVVGGDFTCDEVRVLTERHLATVRRKRADLQRMERVLAAMVAECREGEVPECPIADALFPVG